MILRTVRSLRRNTQVLSACLPLMKLNEKASFFLPQTQNNTNMFYQKNSKYFSTNTQKNDPNLDGILSELESQSLENFEEPFVIFFF